MNKIKDLRVFGLIWTGIFLIIAFIPIINKGSINYWGGDYCCLFFYCCYFKSIKTKLFLCLLD